MYFLIPGSSLINPLQHRRQRLAGVFRPLAAFFNDLGQVHKKRHCFQRNYLAIFHSTVPVLLPQRTKSAPTYLPTYLPIPPIPSQPIPSFPSPQFRNRRKSQLAKAPPFLEEDWPQHPPPPPSPAS